MVPVMKIFWNGSGDGPEADDAKEANLQEAMRVWSDEMTGVEGDFLGLVDGQDRTIQFIYDEDVPEDADDVNDLAIITMDFPRPEKQGSYTARVTIGAVGELIGKAFKAGADPGQFDDVEFVAW